jgi:DNA repair protein RecO (recombination protein O)
MALFSSPAILIRRLDYGDFDLIITFLTYRHGKITAIAKSAKRSTKRFSGVLELFSLLDIVVSKSNRKGLPVLTEASFYSPLSGIRGNITKTALASYWAELVNDTLEEGRQQTEVFQLLDYVLKELDAGEIPDQVLSILFQMRLLTLSGLCPNLNYCCTCHSDMTDTGQHKVNVDPAKGGVVCEHCTPYSSRQSCLSKGTIKQLQWLNTCELNKAGRIRFSATDMHESLAFLEAFVPYHLGREPKSLKFLRRLRMQAES